MSAFVDILADDEQVLQSGHLLLTCPMRWQLAPRLDQLTHNVQREIRVVAQRFRNKLQPFRLLCHLTKNKLKFVFECATARAMVRYGLCKMCRARQKLNLIKKSNSYGTSIPLGKQNGEKLYIHAKRLT